MRALLVIGMLALVAGCVSPTRIARSAAKVDLGAAYYREGNTEGAITTLRDAAKLDPRAWRPQNALAIAYIAKGELDLADEAFRRARRVAPGEAEVLNNHGTLLLKTGRLDEAILAFELALQDLDYRTPAMIHSNLAYALVQAGRADEALPYAREATRRAPTMCEAWFHLGLVQEARTDALAALEAYRQVSELCPADSLGSRLRTGCLQVQVGLADEGRAALEDVVITAPGTPFADEARACLDTLPSSLRAPPTRGPSSLAPSALAPSTLAPSTLVPSSLGR
ncbi:MAG: tetratricopeptide repeat protein [Pseudomonadota bacterium]|nr:tetratricopeptide repeat protein [Pseudomonadota bacterium]